jgi:hypothetical protein
MAGLIAFDIDGVLADFLRGFTRIGHRRFGTPICDTHEWMFKDDFPEVGLDTAACEEIWQEVKNSQDFWATLDPRNVSVMHRINHIQNKIFITNRPGCNTAQQTVHFLETWGVENPKVILASEKGPVAKQENVVAVVDDLHKNCIDIKRAVPGCFTALLYCEYNKPYQQFVRDAGCHVVLSVDQFIDGCYARGLVSEPMYDSVDARIKELLKSM